MERFVDRFLRYVKKNTRSDESKAGIVIPSTPSQMEFLEELSEELKRIGLEDVKINKKNAFLTATVPAKCGKRSCSRIYFTCGYSGF